MRVGHCGAGDQLRAAGRDARAPEGCLSDRGRRPDVAAAGGTWPIAKRCIHCNRPRSIHYHWLENTDQLNLYRFKV